MFSPWSATFSTSAVEPTRPKQIPNHHHKEGFWYSEHEPYYPKPVSSSRSVDPAFLARLESVLAIGHLPFAEQDAIHNAKIDHFKGSSCCRLCGRKNGSQTFNCKRNGATWSFPQGIIHYYKDHHVQPSEPFRMFIMDFVLKTKVKSKE